MKTLLSFLLLLSVGATAQSNKPNPPKSPRDTVAGQPNVNKQKIAGVGISAKL